MDIVVVGTGVSSVLLAQHLVRLGGFRTLRLIGPGTAPRAQRLAYWGSASSPFDDFADGAWQSLRIFAGNDRALDLSLARFTYRTCRPQPWHAAALAGVLALPGVDLIEARAESVETVGDRAVVRAGNARIEGDWVVCGAQHARRKPAAWRRFERWEVELPDGELDPRIATWLDFRPSPAMDLEYHYALPLAPQRLFLEHVSFARTPHAERMTSYLHDVLGQRGWRVLDRERGATPVFSRDLARGVGRVVTLGLGGGLRRVSPGYALTRTAGAAALMAAGMAQHGRPTLPRRPSPLYRVADGFCADLMAHAPHRVPGFLGALFGGADGDTVLTFLDDQASAAEQLQMSRGAPGWLSWWARERDAPPPNAD